jgi:hypothetical protein
MAPEAANHAIREYSAVLEHAAFGAATPAVMKFVSPADPASHWTGATGGLAFIGHGANYLIDLLVTRVWTALSAAGFQAVGCQIIDTTAKQRNTDGEKRALKEALSRRSGRRSPPSCGK